jgi:hypothetical protein
MDQRFFYIAPLMDQLAIDNPRRLSRESNPHSSLETDIQNEQWPFLTNCPADAPCYPWERVHYPVPSAQAVRPQRRLSTLLARAHASLRFVHSG